MNLNKNNSKETIQINNQVLYTAMRMASTDSKVIKRKIQELDKWFIFPFVITNGVIPLTTSGYKPINSVPQDYSSFTLAITGNATIIAQWQDAFKLVQKFKGTKEKDYKDGDQFYTKIINPLGYDTQRGTMYEAYLQNSTSGAYFTNQGTPNSVFQGMDTQRQYTLLSTERQFGQNDELKLYVVLNSTNENIGGETVNNYEYNQSIQWLYISNITDYYDPFDNRKFLFQEITFSSVNDLMNKSGQAIWQKIQHGAIGEGYFFPRIINGVVDYDPELAKDTGVKFIDWKMLGVTAPCSLTVIGRPIKSGQYNERVYQPRDILFSNEYSSLPDTLLINANASHTLYNLQSMIPMNETSYGEWINIFNAMADPLAKKNAEGVISTNLENTRATNGGEDNPPIPFWADKLEFKPKGSYDTRQIRKFIFQDPNYQYAAFGISSFDMSQMASSHLHDILNANRYTHSSIALLPWKVNEYTKFSINNLPIVGKIFSFFDLGLPVKLMSQKDITLIPKINQLNAFMDCQLYNIIQQSLWSDKSKGKGLIPYDLFRNETEDEVGGLLGAKSMTTGFLLELTDKINTGTYFIDQTPQGNKVMSTLDLGQQKNVGLSQSLITLLTNDFQAQPKDTPLTYLDNDLQFNPTADGTLESYVIDMIAVQALGKCDFKITTYSESPFFLNDDITTYQNFQGQWQTFSKFIDNISSWVSVIKTSALDYDTSEQTTFFYPKKVLPPNPFTFKDYTGILPNFYYYKKYDPIVSNPVCVGNGNVNYISAHIGNIGNANNPATDEWDFEFDLSQVEPTLKSWNALKSIYKKLTFNWNAAISCEAISNQWHSLGTWLYNGTFTGGVGNCNQINIKGQDMNTKIQENGSASFVLKKGDFDFVIDDIALLPTTPSIPAKIIQPNITKTSNYADKSPANIVFGINGTNNAYQLDFYVWVDTVNFKLKFRIKFYHYVGFAVYRYLKGLPANDFRVGWDTTLNSDNFPLTVTVSTNNTQTFLLQLRNQ